MAAEPGCRAAIFQYAGAIVELSQSSLVALKDAILSCILFCANCCCSDSVAHEIDSVLEETLMQPYTLLEGMRVCTLSG